MKLRKRAFSVDITKRVVEANNCKTNLENESRRRAVRKKVKKPSTQKSSENYRQTSDLTSARQMPGVLKHPVYPRGIEKNYAPTPLPSFFQPRPSRVRRAESSS